MRSNFRPSLLLAVAGWICASASGQSAARTDLLPLEEVSRFDIVGGASPAKDVRWASDSTVFIARTADGVEEVHLAAGLPRVRQVMPEAKALRGIRAGFFYRLGVSGAAMVAAHPTGAVAWRSGAGPAPGIVRFDRVRVGPIEDLDLLGERVAWIGSPEPAAEDGSPAARGFIWWGTLGKRLLDRQALATSATARASEAPVWRCSLLGISALRFGDDGSLFAAPGFADEATLFDSGGRPTERFDLRLLGLTTPQACPTVGDDERRSRLDLSDAARADWINGQRVIDDAVMLPDGPALIVRELREGRPRWQLVALREPVRTAEIALPDAGPYDRLKADARAGRLVVLQVRDDRLFGEKPAGERLFVYSLTAVKPAPTEAE